MPPSAKKLEPIPEALSVSLGLVSPPDYLEIIESQFDERDFVFVKLEVREIGYGKCVIAREDIRKGQRLARFYGEIKPFHHFNFSQKPYLVPMGGGLWINPVGIPRYFNHSCAPNCELQNKIDLVARRPIKSGEELSFRYNVFPTPKNGDVGSVIEEARWDHGFTFVCECGAKNCVKVMDRNLVADR